MMRPIRFRAWDKENKKMSSPFTLYEIAETTCDEDDIEWTEKLSGRDEFIVMQFTGLRDCKGKEIYEGDIVCVHKLNAEVFYWEDHADYRLVPFDCRNEWDKTRSITFAKFGIVIGNIYESPELLESK